MSQDKKPQFSHITVGSAAAASTVQSDEEDLIIIGAQEADSDVLFSEIIINERQENTSVVEKQGEIKEHDNSKNRSKEQEGGDQEIAKMPFLQKMILLFCAVAFLIAIAMVVSYRVTNG